MNIDDIKKEFPIFDEKIQNNDLVYLDSACLLYTSPSPRDRQISRMPSCA